MGEERPWVIDEDFLFDFWASLALEDEGDFRGPEAEELVVDDMVSELWNSSGSSCGFSGRFSSNKKHDFSAHFCNGMGLGWMNNMLNVEEGVNNEEVNDHVKITW